MGALYTVKDSLVTVAFSMCDVLILPVVRVVQHKIELVILGDKCNKT